MKTKISALLRLLWKPLVALAGLIVLIVWTTGILRERVSPGVVDFAPGLPLPADAETLTVHPEEIPRRVDVVGSVTSDNTVLLGARVSAYVSEVRVSAGDPVERNQVLIRLDDRDLRTQREAARAALRRAETEYERYKSLHETQFATDQEYIQAESAYHTAMAQLEQADVMLTFTEIRSPMDGIVSDRHAEVGMLANPGQTLLTVYDPTVMRLDAPVPVRLTDYLAIGDPLDVRLERPDTVIPGRINRIVSEIDPRTRTQTVQIMLDTDDLKILPGTFGRLQLGAAEQRVIMVPASAVYRVGQLEFVQIVEEDRAIRRLIKTGAMDGHRVEVLSGLQDGETILVQPVK